MNRVGLFLIMMLYAAAVSRGGPPVSWASEEGHGGGGHHSGEEMPMKAPDTLGGLWQAIDAKVAELDRTIAAGELAKVHQVAFAIRDLVQQLPGKSGDLPEAKQKMLQGLVGRVGEHAKMLDTYGDAGKAKETADEAAQLKTRLAHIRALYPEPAGGSPQKHESHGASGSRSGSGPDTSLRTVTGQVADAHCYDARGAEAFAPAHRDCTIRCMKEGKPAVVRDEATGNVYLASASATAGLDELLAAVGQRVRVRGNLAERDGLGLIEVAAVQREHDHDAAPHGGVVGMIGERHIEVVSRPDGEIRVFLLDDFMRPLSVADAGGAATVRGKGGSARDARLSAAPDGKFLVVRGIRLTPEDEDITVDFSVGGERLFMTLPFPDGLTDAASASDHHMHQHPH